MTVELQFFWLLLCTKARGMVRLRSGHARRDLSPAVRDCCRAERVLQALIPSGAWLFAVFWLGMGFLFAYGIFAGTEWFLRQCLAVELVGQFIPRKLMTLVLLILASILVLSTTISSFSVFFLSEDLVLLQSAPIPIGPLYFARFVEMILVSSWMVWFFGLPLFLAYGRVYQASLAYYLALAGIFPLLMLIPAALGAVIATILTWLFSARRSRDLLIVLVMVGFVVVYLLIRAIKPEQLLSPGSFGSMMEFLNMFRAPDLDWLPTVWATNVLFPLLLGKPVVSWLPLLGVLATALGMCTVCGMIGTTLYVSGFCRAQEGRVRDVANSRRGRILGNWFDWLGGRVGQTTGAFLVKDVRVFWRDTNQWLQLLLLFALGTVYLLNFVYLRVANFNWFTLYTVNHVLLGLVVSGVAVRFVFPAVSLEGHVFWLVRVAPVRLQDVLHSKLLVHFVPLFLLGQTLAIASCMVIGVPLLFVVLSASLVAAMTLAITCLGIGWGALYPRFHVESPAKIPTGVGGVSFMVLGMGFVLVFLLVSLYPLFVLFQLPRHLANPIPQPLWFYGSLAGTALLTIGGCFVPMLLGRTSLERREQ
jgi:ABC-2 type transport system permease protein